MKIKIYPVIFLFFFSFCLHACALDFGIEKKDGSIEDGDVDTAEGDFRPEEITDTIPDEEALDVPLDVPPDEAIDTLEAVEIVEDDTAVDDTPVDNIICEPGTQWCTVDGDVESCNTDGTSTTIEECLFGCSDTPDVHCLELIPSNVDDASLLCVPGTTDFSPSSPVRYVLINTDTGAIHQFDAGYNEITPAPRAEGEGLISGINFVVQSQESGFPDIGIFSVNQLYVPPGIIIAAFGRNAFVLLSCGDVNIEGSVSGGAIMVSTGPITYYLPGPGGGAGGEGPGAGIDGNPGDQGMSGGGGGGSFGGIGGTGGTSVGGNPGSSYGNADLVPLIGGSGGGMGADNDPDEGLGGPGGGAVQIVSPGSITVYSGGIIEANGWGGFRGYEGSSTGAGGGGGSGGAILLEAHTITIDSGGFVTANGGGGGSGSSYSTGHGENGERGRMNLTPAAGGAAGASETACAGGDGNSSMDISGGSVACPSPHANGGGGGGAAGIIRFNAEMHSIVPNTTSPSMTAIPTTATTGDLNLQ